ncbi:MAG TPA: DUF998 domain-containing protein [Gaiellaceae bacterium]|nr:DUF998 domain-containing protein [Gaiellaceae bacterium]
MTTAFAAVSLCATVVCLAALVRLHLLPTGYRLVSNAVSDYGVGPFRQWYRAQTSALAVAAAALAVAIALAAHDHRRVVVLLGVFAAARLTIPSFPTDLDRTRPTRTGRIHLWLAAIAFATIAWAAGAYDRYPVVDWLVIGTSIATFLALRRPYFGAVERLFYAAMLAWFVVVSVNLI